MVNPRHLPVAYRFALSALLVVLLALLFLVYFGVHALYQQMGAQADKEAARLNRLFTQALAEPLVRRDYNQLTDIIRTGVHQGAISHAELFGVKGQTLVRESHEPGLDAGRPPHVSVMQAIAEESPYYLTRTPILLRAIPYGTLEFAIPIGYIYTARNALVTRFLLTGAVVFVLSLSVFVLLGHLFDRKLRGIADQIEGGHLQRRSDEFSHLADSFNALVEKQRRDQEALRRARDELEQRVAERTAELARAKNAAEAVSGALTVSERRLQESQRIAHLGQWELDIQNDRLHWSDETYRLFEIDREHFAASYEDFLALVHPEDRAAVNLAYSDSLANKTPYEIIHRLRMPDGRVKFVREQCRTEFDGDTPLHSIGTIQDITMLKEKELELELARKSAERASRAKSLFLANMSHELRTPLNAVLGFSELMRLDGDLKPEQKSNLDIINRSGHHLLQLINDVLDMSKVEAGKTQLEPEELDLGALIRDVTDMVRVRAEKKGLQLLLDQASDFPRFIRGDGPKIRQILINLLGNSVKFTDQGGVTLRLKSIHQDAGWVTLHGEVQDTGRGIQPEDRERIFQPFEQLSDSPDQKGTGLGLAIARQFVELMGGEISVASQPDKGSTFYFSIRVESSRPDQIHPTDEQEPRRVIGLRDPSHQWRILIADDQLENQLLLRQLLKPRGFQVRIAEDGIETVQLFQQWHPHLIWMDRRMPRMDGLAATRKIRELPGGDQVKIAALTASVFKEDKEMVMEAGCDDFVRKPFRPHEIFDCMARHLDLDYLYEETTVDESAGSTTSLTPEALAALPAPLLEELERAVTVLDVEQTQTVVKRIAAASPDTAASLG
ncbi:MAG: hypothetical protein B0D90_01690, partial [Candidatus Sedimenticola endophacoides]